MPFMGRLTGENTPQPFAARSTCLTAQILIDYVFGTLQGSVFFQHGKAYWVLQLRSQ